MKFVAVALAALQGAAAHTIFTQLNGNPVGSGIRDPSYDGPQQDVTVNYMACNGGANPTTPSSNVLTVQAGSQVSLTWRHTLTSAANDVIDASHKGPVMVYMKKVSDAKSDPGYGGGWFKIQQDGYSGGQWGVDRLIANQGIQKATIPSCIAPGQYLLRGEILALHAATSQGGAQFYMECAQINVVGGTGAKTPATVSIPGAYKATDPGILVNIYSMTSSSTYTIPGPPVFTC